MSGSTVWGFGLTLAVVGFVAAGSALLDRASRGAGALGIVGNLAAGAANVWLSLAWSPC